MEGNVVLFDDLDDLTKEKHVNREQDGTQDGALWDTTGETSWGSGRIAYVDREASITEDADQFKAEPITPTPYWRQLIKMLWSTVPNAAVKLIVKHAYILTITMLTC